MVSQKEAEKDDPGVEQPRKKSKKKMKQESQDTSTSPSRVKFYIGNVGEKMTETELQKFLQACEVDIAVQTDGKRMGFAFAYVDSSMKDKVLEKNGATFQGCQLKVAVAAKQTRAEPKKPDKKVKQSQKFARIFVGNISNSTDRLDLMEYLGATSIKIPEDEDGNRMGHAVALVPPQEKHLTLKLNRMEMDGKKLVIKEINEKSPKLFIGNLSPDTTEESLTSIFKNVKDVNIVKTAHGKKRGFGFLEFENPNDAEDALEKYDDHIIDGREISLDYVKVDRPASEHLLATNLNTETDSNRLHQLFDCTHVHIMKHEDTDKSKGIAFLDFANVHDARRAKRLMDRKLVDGNKIQLRYTSQFGVEEGKPLPSKRSVRADKQNRKKKKKHEPNS